MVMSELFHLNLRFIPERINWREKARNTLRKMEERDGDRKKEVGKSYVKSCIIFHRSLKINFQKMATASVV
jgi:hypothetical protein